MKYAEVAVNYPAWGKGIFSYSIPPHLSLQVGQGVWVPFGKRTLPGIIFELTDTPQVESTKDILSALSPQPLLTPAQTALASWISSYYLCTSFMSASLMLTPGFQTRITVEIEILGDMAGSPSLSSDQLTLINRLSFKGRFKQDRLEKEIDKKEVLILLSRLESEGLIKRHVLLKKERARPKLLKIVCLKLSFEEAGSRAIDLSKEGKERQSELMLLLVENNGLLSLPYIRQHSGYSPSVLKSWINKGWVQLEEKEVLRDPLSAIQLPPYKKPELTPAQKAACSEIAKALDSVSAHTSSSQPEVFLLHGVTGSGKTEVYLEAVEKALSLGKRSLVLVPEISLTTQTIERFLARFPGQVAVIHSRLSLGERFDEWRRIRNGEFGVVIGSRSAIFAPQPDLGLIVIDEEHEWSYKNQDMPRYHARDVALEMARSGVVVVLGSATPDVESYYHALSGRFKMLNLPGRITPAGEAPLPNVQLVNMRDEYKTGSRGFLGRTLLNNIAEVLQKKEQVILFLNRRGFSTLVLCKSCGYVFRCKRCFVALTYHSQRNVLLCHQCNLSIPVMQQCPKCNNASLRFRGMGTEGLEEEVRKAFPGARTLRWDSDTVKGKGIQEKILSEFRSHKADILIGTQMIAKGLDLPLVTLVGIVMADLGLQLPHYKAEERVFQLLCQAAGRAGRGIREGKVVIQTYNPQHYAINLAARQDYAAFYEKELFFRRQYGYPPFLKLASLSYVYSNQQKCQQETQRLKEELLKEIDKKGLKNITVLGPTPSFPEKVRGRFSWNLMIKSEDPVSLIRDIRLGKGWSIDIDPASSV